MYACVFVFVQVCVLECRFLKMTKASDPQVLDVHELGLELRPTARACALSCSAIFPAP